MPRRPPRSPRGQRVDKPPIDAETTGPREPGMPTDSDRYGDFVANTKSAEKAARQAEKHRARNIALRSRMRSALRRVIAAIATGNKETARTSYQQAVPLIDTLVTKKIVHRNKAARHKSRLAARIRQMQAKA